MIGPAFLIHRLEPYAGLPGPIHKNMQMSIFQRKGEYTYFAVRYAHAYQVKSHAEIIFASQEMGRQIAVRAQVEIAGAVGAVRIDCHHSRSVFPSIVRHRRDDATGSRISQSC